MAKCIRVIFLLTSGKLKNQIAKIATTATVAAMGMEMAFDFLENINADEFTEGKTEIIGNHLFANGMVRETKDFAEYIWESHKKYLDIHFLVEGEERIFYGPEDKMTEVIPYNNDKEITVFEGNGTEVYYPQNGFIIFLPGEIHKALVHTSMPEAVKKVVIKLGLEE